MIRWKGRSMGADSIFIICLTCWSLSVLFIIRRSTSFSVLFGYILYRRFSVLFSSKRLLSKGVTSNFIFPTAIFINWRVRAIEMLNSKSNPLCSLYCHLWCHFFMRLCVRLLYSACGIYANSTRETVEMQSWW